MFKKTSVNRKRGHVSNVKRKSWQVEKEEINILSKQYSNIDVNAIQKFDDLPLSKHTLKGLKDTGYTTLTDIQRMAAGPALRGLDILGAAKTGSGKTLAFLVPALEMLYRNQWSKMDGLGVLIITPTRELAYQIFEVLKKVGNSHEFSAALIIGGKNVEWEMNRIDKANVIICTPGRLLQHMDQNPNFSSDSLKMLVLDEADRILDLGFQKSVNAIIENLPQRRQTLLFSATQTKSVKDLARLSLQNPEYVAVHENSEHSTPKNLQQSYTVCELHEKLDVLYSFIKNHLKKKILVFLSSCKQVKYVNEAFCHLRPGVPLLALHGKMHQVRRTAVYEEFCRKERAVLFATDVAARGLDFPAVHWVVQADCPEDANTYIHRVGRTARYEENGEALLILNPSEEEGMLAQLGKKKIPVESIGINPTKMASIQPKLESMCAKDPEMKASAQRAFIAYLKSIYLMADKSVFDIFKLDTKKFSFSLGLALTPRIRFLQKVLKQKQQTLNSTTSQDETILLKMGAGSESGNTVVVETEGRDDGSEDDELTEFKSNLNLNSKTVKSKPVGNSKSSKKKLDRSAYISESESEEEEERPGKVGVGVVLEEDDPDQNEDVFVVKRKDIFHVRPGEGTESQVDRTDDQDEGIPSLETETTEVPTKTSLKKKMKVITKTGAAKKMLKKNITVNSKIVFGDAGEVVEAWGVGAGAQDDNDNPDGGIDLTDALNRMKEADKHDKLIFKERVRQKHKEERIKRKEQMRKLRGHAEDNDETAGVQLDVDNNDTVEKSVSEDGHSSGDSDTDMPPVKKMKNKNKKSKDDVRVNVNTFDEGENTDEELPLDTGLSLKEDEQLVMHLLKN